jgi:hypothetical protein
VGWAGLRGTPEFRVDLVNVTCDRRLLLRVAFPSSQRANATRRAWSGAGVALTRIAGTEKDPIDRFVRAPGSFTALSDELDPSGDADESLGSFSATRSTLSRALTRTIPSFFNESR